MGSRNSRPACNPDMPCCRLSVVIPALVRYVDVIQVDIVAVTPLLVDHSVCCRTRKLRSKLPSAGKNSLLATTEFVICLKTGRYPQCTSLTACREPGMGVGSLGCGRRELRQHCVARQTVRGKGILAHVTLCDSSDSWSPHKDVLRCLWHCLEEQAR